MVRVMPGPPEWKLETISLPDAPDEPQTFYYRDIEQCAHYLFQRSDLAKSMDYVPMEVCDIRNGDRIYHEMCSAHEWNKQQVSRKRY